VQKIRFRNALPSARRALAAGLAIVSLQLLVAAGVNAQGSPAEGRATVEFNISPGALDNVLNAFARHTGMDVAVDAALTAGQSTDGVQGRYSNTQALEMLLAGTGLQARMLDPGTVTLIPAPPAGEALGLSPVMVTGEFTERSLTQTTASVSVITEAELERKDSERVFDAMRAEPNLTPAPLDFLPGIRGVESGGPLGAGGAILGSAQPRAKLIVDDVATINTYPNNALQSSFDVEQVEVLRGPQTTLRGSNSISGAFVVQTKDPVHRLEGEAEAGVNWNDISDEGYNAAVMVNTPVVQDEVALRLTATYVDDRVPVQIYDDGGAPPDTDFDALSEYDTLSLRAKLLVEPKALPALSALFSIQTVDGRDVGFDSYSWGGTAVFPPDGIPRAREDRLYGYSGGQRIFDTEDRVYTSDLRYAIGDYSELRSITAWQTNEYQDAPDSNSGNAGTTFDRLDREQLSQDIIFTSESGSGLDMLLGASYSKQEGETEAGGTVISSTDENTQESVFGDLTYHLTYRFRLHFGARYLKSDVTYDGLLFGAPVMVDQQETEWLPKFGASYDISADQTLFAMYREGFNPGGGSIDFLSLSSYEFDPEYVSTYETGYRAAFMNNRISFNATAFFNDYKDYQFFFFDPSVPASQIVNFDGQSYGAEFEVTARVSEQVELNAALGLLRTEIDEADQPIDGNEFGQDPPYTVSLGGVWQATPAISLDASAQWVDEYWGDFNNDPGTESGDYLNLDIGATYQVGAVRMRGFVRNVTDKYQYFDRDSAEGDGYVLPPREVGVTMNYAFQ